tara:strand:+ start:43 stop:171 length:129 start_codon:yes stop_codon:yes gene_type:complete
LSQKIAFATETKDKGCLDLMPTLFENISFFFDIMRFLIKINA